ncbi:hypothetical protein SAMN02745121_08334 [Nannocystis exedens]|uniref:HTTM-like domain-containing protein n=1 Tax=Nannocystis exedens TaxID=54 RepID=A0A1I2H7I1_9BACT|nr:hypothetical protein NAEX_00057 [Nannocystis exedens]SFF25323.1 hypothetical protein SAMN02745121_07735 [Nannocystis exedens]SFF35292.1 hypothetical protein SAMN02745121_08334 [Nannocystis exedens]
MALALTAASLVGLVALHREGLRRVLLRAVDPRPLALFRIAFGCCLLVSLLEIAPLAPYLFSDEGIVPRAAVPELMGRGALVGFGDGVREPAGPRDAWAVAEFVSSGRWSPLYFGDSPGGVAVHLGLLLAAALALTLGFRTRLSAIATWLLYAGLLRRGDAHWGGEQVFCAFLFLLTWSRCGAAYSVDNWRRCRALRRRGLLSMPSGPGAGAGAAPSPAAPRGLAAIYRRIPAWPQALIAAQLALCYAANGWAKAGTAWQTGDALLLVLLRDTYVRWDMSAAIAAVGPWPLRLASWGVMWWERLFPLVLVGLAARALGRSGAPALRGPASAAARLCWGGLAGAAAIAAAVPMDLVEKPGTPGAAERAAALAVLAAVCAAVAIAGPRAGAAARRLAAGPLAPKWWLGFGALFHLGNHALLAVGAFAPATLAAYLVCGAGPWAVATLRRALGGLARRGVPVPEHLREETACEDPSLPHQHRDAAALPGWAIGGAGMVVLAGGAIALIGGAGARAWHAAWLAAGTGLTIAGWRIARRERGAAVALPEPWAHGPAGRLAAGGLVAYHVVALLVWQLPAWPGLPWRAQARTLVGPWIELSFTSQVWSMFAPNPPRDQQLLRATVVDAAGVRHRFGEEPQRVDDLPRPHPWHDRWRKIADNVLGQRERLAQWHARYLCRRWALEHAGEPPREVLLEGLRAPLPLPGSDLREHFAGQQQARVLMRVDCADEPFAQLAPEVRARHGLAPAPAGSLRFAWERPATWAERKARRDPLAPLWPLAALGLLGALARWAREDRRAHVAARAARAGEQERG